MSNTPRAHGFLFETTAIISIDHLSPTERVILIRAAESDIDPLYEIIDLDGDGYCLRIRLTTFRTVDEDLVRKLVGAGFSSIFIDLCHCAALTEARWLAFRHGGPVHPDYPCSS